MQSIIIILVLWCLTVNFSFGRYSNNIYYESILGFRLVVFFSFILEIFVALNLGYYKKGNFISDREKIFKRYFKSGYFFCDLLAFLPICASFHAAWQDDNTTTGRYVFEALCLLKFITIRRKEIVIDQAILFRFENRFYYNIFNFIIFVVFYTHVCACVFWGYQHIEITFYGMDNTILNLDDYINNNWWD